MSDLILASKSKHRAQLLENAGVEFQTISAQIDEREVEAPILKAGLGASDVAEVLAIAKATEVSGRYSASFVIGCDQTLSFQGNLIHKPKDMEEAHRRLLALSGKSHRLNSAVALVSNGEVLWSYVESCQITFRKLDPAFIGRYTSSAGDKILSSVGAYQIEGIGINLIEKIEGDFFSIIGLPLLPLLAELRNRELIDG